MRVRVVGLLALLLTLSVQAFGQVGSHLKEEFQDPEKHGVRIISRASEIRSAVHDPTVKVLCLQLFGTEVSSEAQQELLDWVRAGRTLWFYDARLAPLFGMQPYFLSSEQFRHRPEKGVLGASKRSGLATVGISFGAHAVQTGVGQVTVFLPEIEHDDSEKRYGAVEVAGDTLPLLRFALDSPAVVAMRREGRGLIVFKTLLWTEPLSGDRFQRNLLDFSAGYPVPGPAGEGKVGQPPGPEAEYVVGQPALPLPSQASEGPSATVSSPPGKASPSAGLGLWTAQLRDGTKLSGDWVVERIEFETGTESLKLKLDDVEALHLGSSVSLDRLTTRQGKTHSGLLLSWPLKLRTERGVEEFEKEDLELIERQDATVERER